MKSISRILLAGFITASAHSLAPAASTPYLETMPATFLWKFNITGVGSSRIPEPIETTVIEDPEALIPTDRITTDTGAPVTYSGGNGNQAFFVQHLLRAVLEDYAVRSVETEDADEATRLEGEIEYLKKHLNDKWELTLVRLPQASVAEALNSPYWVFLSKIDFLQNRALRAYDTGMRIVPKYSAGTITETLGSETVVKVAGNVTTYFQLEFESTYGADPLHAVDLDARRTNYETKSYNTSGERWHAFGRGYMTYTLRSTAGAPLAVAPAKMKATAFGSWIHTIFSTEDFETFGGTAPLSIRMGEVKYQRSEFFPDFTL